MKKNFFFIIFTMTVATFISCTKSNTSTEDGPAAVVASKTDKILIGEPVTFAFSENLASNVKWTVSPSNSAQVNTAGNKAAILFGQTAKYTITATSGNASASTTVSVSTDTASNENPGSTITPLTPGEKFSVKISAIDTAIGTPGAGFIIYVTTKGLYPCAVSRLATEMITHNLTNYTININGVEQASNCSPMYNFPSNISAYHSITNPWSMVLDPREIITETTTLNFKVNGNTYTGTIKKLGTNYTINWPDRSVIDMAQEVTRII